MMFESFAKAHSVMLWSTFGIALVMGAVANKTNFCTMGAVSDGVNMGDWGRMRAWLLAIAVAMIGVVTLEHFGMLNANGSYPPYRSSQFVWSENLLGGFLFGIGMTLGSGCANKTLVRIGAGNLKSLVVLLVLSVFAYFMVSPFPGSDQTLYSMLFYHWMHPMAVSLSGQQDLGSIVHAANPVAARLWIGGIVALGLLYFVFKSEDFRGSFNNIFAGVVIGLCVLAAWYVTSNILVNSGGDHYTLQSFAQQWDFLSDSSAGKPADVAPLAAQSFTFVNPTGQTLAYVTERFSSAYLTFGVMSVFGVILGSFLWAVIRGGFRIEWFAGFGDFVRHVFGGALMGIGGVLGMGCTIGQGITGVSTLASGSIITFLAIVFGAALTMKVQYYKMVYEDASLGTVLVTALVDMRLLPSGLRKLEAV